MQYITSTTCIHVHLPVRFKSIAMTNEIDINTGIHISITSNEQNAL